VLQPEDVARRAEDAKAAAPNAYAHTRGFLLRAASWRGGRGDDSGDVPAGESAQSLGASASGPPCWHAQYVSDRLVFCPVWAPEHKTQGIAGFAYGAAESIGKRLSQEDRCVAVPSLRATFPDVLGPDSKDAALFAILDGHGGSATSELLAQMLPPAVAKALARSGASVQAAVAEACRDVETRLPDPVADEACSGSTACIVLVASGDAPSVTCANVGDSRAVLFRGGLPVPLSTDHRVSEPRERARILAAGGSITNNRLNGVLSVSRAFGDKEHKAQRGGEMWGTVFSADPCSAEPEFTQRELSVEDDFIVVACDGLWDVLSNEDVGCFLTRRLTASRDVAAAARGLVAKALEIGSSDNISAIVIGFASRGPHPPGGGAVHAVE
jgi:serine/threonine protein phosphatase PrpC